jgi:type 1 glutamine amidotransferase
MSDFQVVDEPYIATLLDETAQVLLTARYSGDAPGYVLGHWADDSPRAQLYVRRHGAGAVLYCTLGHACGRYDMQPLMEETTPIVGPWDNPHFLEVIRRGLKWLGGPRADDAG